MRAIDVMRRSFATVRPETPILEAVWLLLETNQRGLPVVSQDGYLVGMVSEQNIVGLAGHIDLSSNEKPRCVDPRSSSSVEELMIRKPVCIDKDECIGNVVKLFNSHGFDQAFVVLDGKPIGIISQLEIISALERLLANR